jgi:hypothetical protein
MTSSPLAGLAATLPFACSCGATSATINAQLQLRCTVCNADHDTIGGRTARFLAEVHNDNAIIARSDGKYYATLTCSCGRARGSLTESTGNWIEAIVDRFGESVTIVLRRVVQPAEAGTVSGSVQ